MTLEQQVTNLDLSKKLKELGVKQESLFYWHEVSHGGVRHREPNSVSVDQNFDQDYKSDTYTNMTCSAFTVAELAEMLPVQMTYGKDEPFLTCTKDLAGGWVICYADLKNGATGKVIHDKNEANARARMLIYLIENNLLSTKNRKDTER